MTRSVKWLTEGLLHGTVCIGVYYTRHMYSCNQEMATYMHIIPQFPAIYRVIHVPNGLVIAIETHSLYACNPEEPNICISLTGSLAPSAFTVHVAH